MEESSSVRSSLASVRDDESIYVCYGFLPSKQSDSDFFLLGFPSISPEAMGGSRKNFRGGEPSIVGIKVAQLNILLKLQLRTLLVVSQIPV